MKRKIVNAKEEQTSEQDTTFTYLSIVWGFVGLGMVAICIYSANAMIIYG